MIMSKQWNITIPMLRQIIFFVSVISTMGAFKEFTLMLVMTGGGPVNSTTTLVYLVFKEAFENINMGYASAIATVLFVLILIITDRKSTRLNSSHVAISYAVFCLQKQKLVRQLRRPPT